MYIKATPQYILKKQLQTNRQTNKPHNNNKTKLKYVKSNQTKTTNKPNITKIQQIIQNQKKTKKILLKKKQHILQTKTNNLNQKTQTNNKIYNKYTREHK